MADLLKRQSIFNEWADSMEINLENISGNLCESEIIKDDINQHFLDENKNNHDSINNDIKLNEVQVNLLDVSGFKERN